MLSRWKKSLSMARAGSSSGNFAGVHSANGDATGVSMVDRSTFHCKLCLAECHVDQMYTLDHCKCSFCVDCVKQYIEVSIDDGNVISIACPDFECHRLGVISAAEIKKLVTVEQFRKFTRLHFEREVDLDPMRTFCPTPNCESVCSISRATAASAATAQSIGTEPLLGVGNDAVPVHCRKCGISFCSMCKSVWHPSKSCDDNMRASHGEIDGIPFSSAEDALIKRCPVCHVPIERDAGCAQMMCKRCKHVFCWYCLMSLDDDILLRHYDRGRCKNKLGHSRASVIWHRVQVVGIFTGFGVLLLVASPFLLLIAPCILCCKCRRCRCVDDDEANVQSLSV